MSLHTTPLGHPDCRDCFGTGSVVVRCPPGDRSCPQYPYCQGDPQPCQCVLDEWPEGGLTEDAEPEAEIAG
jgi:hypothetical protein